MSHFDDATLDALRQKMPDYLELTCGITNLRRPFRCLDPAHGDNHPSMSFDSRTNKVRCFSCDSGGDVFEVAGWAEGASSFPDKVQAVARATGYPLEANTPITRRKPAKAPRKPLHDKPKALDYPNLLNEMQQAVWMLLEESQGKVARDYLHRRGFDNETLAESFVGWAKHPSVLFPKTKAPQCKDGYIVLGFPSISLDEQISEKECSYHHSVPYAVFRMCKTDAKPKELKPYGLDAPIWREHLLTGVRNTSKPVYVTEGVFDAISLRILLDAQACAICGASGTTRLLQIMAHTPIEKHPTLVLSFDNDEAGKGYTDKVSSGLRELGISHSIAPPCPHGCKDANEWLMHSRGCVA